MNSIFRKSISVILGAALTVTSSVCAFAQDIETMDVSSDNWDSTYVDSTSSKLYEDFPMMINKTIGKDMAMSIEMRYLKNLSEDDNAEVAITDLSDGSVIERYQLTESEKFVIWDDVKNGGQFAVTLTENISGTENEYNGFIKTMYINEDFPVDITLGDRVYNNSKDVEYAYVAMKKVGDEPVCNHAEDEECGENCGTASILTFLNEDELNTFYSALDSDCYYELQFDGIENGYTTHYQGFISTYPGGEDLGVFMPGYTFETTVPDDFAMQETDIDLANEYEINRASETISSSGFDFVNNVHPYVKYENILMGNLDTDSNYVVEWVVPEEGKYTIETVGNLDTKMYEFTVNSSGNINSTGYVFRSGGTNGNVSRNISILAGQKRYFVINLERGDDGLCAFRIVRKDYSTGDGISGYRDEVQANCDNGIFSKAKNPDCSIEYNGDVNIFAYNVTKGTGAIGYRNVETDLLVKAYTVSSRVDGIDRMWQEFTVSITGTNNSVEKYRERDFSSGIYYLDVCQYAIPAFGETGYFDSISYGYEFNFYDPAMKDDLDLAADPVYGDSPISPIQVTTFPYTNNTRTLHKGDRDWFSFTTDSEGGNLEAAVHETANWIEYTIALYEDIEIYSEIPPSWYDSENIGTVEKRKDENGDDTNYLTYENLLPNHTYYIEIDRPDSLTYSPAFTYQIDINIVEPSVVVKLNGDVSVTHTVGDNITDLTVLKNAVAEKLTFKINGNEVPLSSKLTLLHLYLNNGILTADIVNSLTPGQYTLIPKIGEIVATGGTVTLTVSEADTPSDIIEIDLPVSTVDEIELDWLHCARAMANYKLSKEGKAQAALTDEAVLTALALDPLESIRVKYTYTAAATSLLYTNGESQSSTAIGKGTNKNLFTETSLYNKLANNGMVIINLADSTDKTNVDSMHYIIICGINRTTRQIKVYDCWQGDEALLTWVDYDSVFNGGFDEGNANIKFYAGIYEK